MASYEIVEGTIKAIENFFADDDWNYEFDEERNAFHTGMRLDNKLKSTKVIVHVSESGLSVFANVAVSADKDCVVAVNEFLARANRGLRTGCFDMNYDRGDMEFRIFHDLTDGVPSREVIQRLILTPIMMVSRYGNGLLSVMFGVKSPAEAVEESERPSSEG